MNAYKELTERQQQEFNALPIKAAFGRKQFIEMLESWNITEKEAPEKIVNIGAGCFMLKEDTPQLKEISERHAAELAAELDADTTGETFKMQMFYYELANHEYIVTGDYYDTLQACGLTWEEINDDPTLKNALKLATEKYLAEYD